VSTSSLRVALTGGIATGKSTCLRRFAALGVPTLDSDRLAREAVAPGTSGLAAVVARFGPRVLTPDGVLDRKALGHVIFSKPEDRTALEAIIHPLVFARISDWFAEQITKAGDTQPGSTGGRQPSFAVADVPLLYEAGKAEAFDAVVVAACPADVQISRLMARDGLSRAEALARIDAQWPIDQKRTRADYVVDTSGTVAETERQVDEIALRLGLKA